MVVKLTVCLFYQLFTGIISNRFVVNDLYLDLSFYFISLSIKCEYFVINLHSLMSKLLHIGKATKF